MEGMAQAYREQQRHGNRRWRGKRLEARAPRQSLEASGTRRKVLRIQTPPEFGARLVDAPHLGQ